MLRQELIDPSRYGLKCPYAMTPKGICIHNTANNAPAADEISYMKRNDLEVSFHIAVDDVESVQGLPFTRNAWHSGDGGNGEGNRNYIALEICYSKSGGEKFIKAEQNAAKVCAYLMKQYGWTIANIKKHQDFSAKNCPHRTLEMGWQRFLNMVQAELNGGNGGSTGGTIKVGTKVKVVGNNYATGQVVPDWVKANTYEVIEVNGDKALLGGILSWVYFKDLTIVSGGGTAPAPNKKFLNLKPHMQSWAIYNPGGPYTTAYKIGNLAPAKFGGLSYEILGNPATDVYVIQTEQFGKVAIWAPRDNDSTITTSPTY